MFLKTKKLNDLSPEIVQWRIDTVEAIGWAGLTAPILLSKGYPVLYAGSSNTWQYPYPTANNPYIDDNLMVAGISLHHADFDLSRLEKLRLITDHYKNTQPEDIPVIKVCKKAHITNCGKSCDKCLKTAIALFAIGEDPKRFGFPVTLKEALDRLERSLSRLKKCFGLTTYISTYRTLWHLNCIQDELYNHSIKGETLDPEWNWFLHTDLTKYGTPTIPIIRQQSNWELFDDLLPAGVTRCLDPQRIIQPSPFIKQPN